MLWNDSPNIFGNVNKIIRTTSEQTLHQNICHLILKLKIITVV